MKHLQDLCRRVSAEAGEKEVIFESGYLAKQASGSVTVRLGETIVLVAATGAREPKEGVDFLPLTVDFRERTYAAGRIPGGFFKREGKLRDKEILASRLADRSIRPLFPEGLNNEIQVQILVVSHDTQNEADILGINGASAALCLSDVPFGGPVGAVRVGWVNEQFVINPTLEQQNSSDLDLVVAGKKDCIMMVECGARELSEELLLQALEVAQREIAKLCQAQEELCQALGKSKYAWTPVSLEPSLKTQVEEFARAQAKQAIRQGSKEDREAAFAQLKKEAQEKFEEAAGDLSHLVEACVDEVFYDEVRRLILEESVRADGRKLDEIRPITCLTGVLPRVHGSAVFTRGQTQALATATLGTPQDMQIMDNLEGEYKEHFLLHYNFPSFSTGEIRPDRGPGRREIGHGALARRALLPLLPSQDEFPYTIRIVSDILESNGSSSMASVCGGSLALFDAGVPMKSSVAGIAMGLITDHTNPGRHAILSDIQGLEDHFGDMDFKVAGTKSGVTALQMDIKIQGISAGIMAKALEQAKQGRLFILDIMDQAAKEPKQELSAFAPRLVTLMIPPEKIGALIGPGGKNIRRICEETGANVEVEDDGRVFISSTDAQAAQAARTMVEGLTQEAELGKIYKGKVVDIKEFGAFVEIMPGKDGLLHISQVADYRVPKVEDVLRIGDEVEVKVIDIDPQGRIKLSRKAVLRPGSELEQSQDHKPRPHSHSHSGGHGHPRRRHE